MPDLPDLPISRRQKTAAFHQTASEAYQTFGIMQTLSQTSNSFQISSREMRGAQGSSSDLTCGDWRSRLSR